MKATLIALAVAGVLASTAAGAASNTLDSRPAPMTYVQYQDNSNDRNATINEREARIGERIQRGISDGRITGREARRLQRELNIIEQKERQFAADGRLSRWEAGELNRDLDRLADHVRQQMRDEERYGRNEPPRYDPRHEPPRYEPQR
jgi:CRISPR/Cas system-associated endoribonuclease Cas2